MPYNVSMAPHLKEAEDIPTIMKLVCMALFPALCVSVLAFGWWALLLTALAVASCVLTEAACQRLRGRPVTVNDWSAVVTGLLLAGVLPVNISWWMPVVGGIFAIAIGKHAFGGLGNNIWNPALLGRAFLGACFAALIFQSSWVELRQPAEGLPAIQDALVGESETLGQDPDVITSATALKQIQVPTAPAPVHSLEDLLGAERYTLLVKKSFFGVEGGCILETSALALLVGGLFLLWRGIITWEIPIPYIVTVGLLGWILPAPVQVGAKIVYTDWFAGPWLLHLVGGGLLLGAFFMATDMVTSPIAFRGRLVFGIGCGLLTIVIRLYAGYPEGVCYSILIMNTCVPLIDAWTRPVKFGARKPEPPTAKA